MSTKQREYKKCREKFAELLREKCNKRCADCGCKAPTWTSQWRVCDAAVFVCLRCAGIHRGLTTDNTFVQSATIDNWNIAKFKKFRNQGGGNNAAMNAMYEAKLPKYSKPTDQTEKDVLRQFIIQKYMEKKWYSNKPKKVKKKNTSQPLLEKNKEKNMDKNKPSKKEYDIEEFEEKSEIMTVKNDYKSPQNQPQSQPIPNLLSVSQMQAIAPTQSKSAGDDLFDDFFSNPNTSSMDDGTSAGSKQNIMNMFNPKPNNNGIHDTFNPDFNQPQNDYSLNKMRMWNQTGAYEYGARARLANDNRMPQSVGAGWNAFDDGQNTKDSKSVIMQQYKQKPSDNFMTSIYGAPQFMNNNQYVNNNNYAMNVNPLKNDGYKKNNYKPMNNNKPKATFSTVTTMGDELFSEFKI